MNINHIKRCITYRAVHGGPVGEVDTMKADAELNEVLANIHHVSDENTEAISEDKSGRGRKPSAK